MLKAKKGNMLMIGLSHMNLDLLKNDKPIKFNMTALGFTENIDVLLFAAETEDDLKKLIMPLTSPETLILDDHNAPNN
jgi:hypothetical protein